LSYYKYNSIEFRVHHKNIPSLVQYTRFTRYRLAVQSSKYRTLFAQRVRKLRKSAKLSLEKAAELGEITGNYWGDVERTKKVPSLDTIVAMARGLGVTPSALLLLEREEDPRDIKKRMDALLNKCTPQQLELIHRIAKVVVEP
jgi:transcriptional regulator with XRE-family HTH domain